MFFVDYKDDFELNSKINKKLETVNTETSDISIKNIVVTLSSSTSIYSNTVVRIDSPSKDCDRMSGTTLVTSVAPPPSSSTSTSQQQLPVAVVLATAAPSLSLSLTSSLLPPLQSCSDNTTILSSSATTSSITTPVHLNNNNTGIEVVANEQLNVTDSSLSNGNLTSITSSSLTVAQTLNLFSSGNNNNTTSIMASDDFVRRLIEAVRKQPCLYNPNHEHYGNKHSSAQYRTIIWQNLCKELDYPGIIF